MSDVLIRGLDDQIIKRLKARAKRHGRSLQGEAKRVLEQAAGADQVAAVLDRWEQRFEGRTFPPSTDLIREDRDR